MGQPVGYATHATGPNQRLVVIGGGISGLAAAVAAKRKAAVDGLSLEVILLEASSRVGGLIRSERIHNCLLEHGPDAVLRKKPAAEVLCDSLGLQDQLVIPQPSRGFFVLHRGRITPLPAGFRMVVPTRILPLFRSRLFSPLGALRLCLERMIPPRRDTGEESLGDFVRRRLGREALERVVQPMLSAIYLGEADLLSADLVLPQLTALVRKYGNLHKGFKQLPVQPGGSFFTLKSGMESLVDALRQELGSSIQTGVAVERLTRNPLGGWSIHRRDGLPLRADNIILATPAHISSTILRTEAATLAQLLADIDHASCLTYHLIYNRSQVTHPLDINGFFVPQSERQPFLAAMSIGSKYPDRVPAHLAAIRVFVGGIRQQEWLEKEPESLGATIHQALTPILGLSGKPMAIHIAQHPSAMPQLNVGMTQRRESIKLGLMDLPGLFLAGGALGAVGLPACIQSGEVAANQVIDHVREGQIRAVV